MTEVMELAGSFASIYKDECFVPTSRMTQNAIYSEMIEPVNCVELSEDDMEYTYGEGQRLVGNYEWNNTDGIN